jgi:hypothetical protein
MSNITALKHDVVDADPLEAVAHRQPGLTGTDNDGVRTLHWRETL